VWVSLSTGSGFTPPEMWLQHGPSTPDQIQYVDVNGDGKADALYFDTSRSNGVWVSLSTGSGFTPPEMWLQHGPSTPNQIQYVDVNGDGKADALYFDTSRSNGVWVSLSTGSSFTLPSPLPSN
jgi:N-acetylglucosamine kinase-like BadF-type ATPase